ncbi:SufS family cysteine desulfurase [Olsenella sp. TM06-36]|uniref:aminotransferase class V-fold PLP-dependent enzyme n=1 Tax=unclassified Olsenella TaxID=2638792 RepID=UPI000E438CD8|nr:MULTISPECIES: SufS family cysteine desulfurase [unclassified Olsenella]RGJ47903.1 SufS family cysteine desulfurase [Olsenella sp. TM06-36]RHJ94265.1 SufS family cysteine desulfurase [Olsenella sp. AM05-7]RHJ98520.1 SufS family cysteine desulfurase [Olsenella sp. AM05-17]
MLTNDELASIEQNPYKADYPLFSANPGLAFLDSAATAQRPAVVLDAQRRFYETMNANPLRGLYRLSVEATEAIAQTRDKVAAFLGAVDETGKPCGNQVVFTRNASEALNLVARTLGRSVLKPGDEVVISIMEHHSNLIPWQQICRETGANLVYLRMDENYRITPEEVAAKVGPRAKIVSVTQVSNVLGVENDVPMIAKRAHEIGAYVVVDGAQSVPHVRVDVRELGCDLLAFSAHKMGGPMGIGVLWGKSEVLDAMPPFLTGGEMIDSVTETDAVWAPVPQKFEAGTQDAAGAYAFGACLDYLGEKGFDALEARERLLARYLTDSLAALPYVDVIGPAEGERHVGSVAFNVRGIHPHDVASILDMNNVCIRAGHHCAQPLLAYLGVENGATCRASIAFYNDKSDVDALVDGLGKVWEVFHGRD